MHILIPPSLAIHVLSTLMLNTKHKCCASVHVCIKTVRETTETRRNASTFRWTARFTRRTMGLEEEEGEGFEKIRNCMTDDICKSGGKAIF